MRRLMFLGLALLALGPSCASTPHTGAEQALVDRSTLTVQELLGGEKDALDAQSLLRRARAAVVCPRMLRGGFFLGAEGGKCVLIARDAAGSWSSPAFYTVGSGSFGLQAGIQDMQVLMVVMNDRALNALLDSQFKLGLDAAIAVATVGGAVSGSTTLAAGADIVAFAQARGLYAGLTLDGTGLTQLSEWNRGYYGRDVGARQIVVAMEAHNPGSDPLRAVMMRYGSAGSAIAAAPATAAAPRSRPAAPPAGGGIPPVATAAPPGAVERSALPPLR
jgi:lipid-binding SYLF domain-containing protein